MITKRDVAWSDIDENMNKFTIVAILKYKIVWYIIRFRCLSDDRLGSGIYVRKRRWKRSLLSYKTSLAKAEFFFSVNVNKPRKSEKKIPILWRSASFFPIWRNLSFVRYALPNDFAWRTYFRRLSRSRLKRSPQLCRPENIFVNGRIIYFLHSLWNKKSLLGCTPGPTLLFRYRTMFKKMTEFGPDSGGRVKVTQRRDTYTSVWYLNKTHSEMSLSLWIGFWIEYLRLYYSVFFSITCRE